MTAREYKTITEISGPLVFLEKTEPVGYGELVNIRLRDGAIKRGQVLDTSVDKVVVQVFEGTSGISMDASVKFLGSPAAPRSSPKRSSRSLARRSTPTRGPRRTSLSRPASRRSTG